MKKLCLILLSFVVFPAYPAQECSRVRAAFDIGSGATKMKVAQVNHCQQRIEKILLEADVPVAYKEDLQKSSDKKLSPQIIDAGIIALKQLKAKAVELGANEFFAVATSAARSAVNAAEFARQIEKSLGLEVRIITQRQEAILGHVAAMASSTAGLEDLIVWDIGGGSMQITTRTNGEYHIYEGQMASVTFKNHVIENIQKKKAHSPNPIAPKEYEQALHDVQVVAKFAMAEEMKKKFQAAKSEVIGIGGVHYYSLGGQLGLKQGESYSRETLAGLIPKRLALNDADLKSSYAETEVSNLILIYGFMQELGISKVKIAKINLADGLLLSGNSLL